MGRKYEAGRGLLTTDAEGVHLNLRPCGGKYGRYFQHMRRKLLFGTGSEVVSIIFHKCCCALSALRHFAHYRHERARFIVAFGPETNTLRHNILHGEAGQLFKAV